MMQSRQVEMEKQSGASSTSCATIFIPDDEKEDGSINIKIQRDAGFQIKRDLDMGGFKIS